MSMTKIAMIAASLVMASPMMAHASASFVNCSDNGPDCASGPSLVGKKVTTYGLLDSSNAGGFDPFVKSNGQKIVKVLVPADKLFSGGNAFN